MKARKWLALILSVMLLSAAVPASAATAPCQHHYVKKVIDPATCTEWGLAVYTCDKCGDSYQDEIEPLGHMFRLTKTTATCLEKGINYYNCARCGLERIEYRDARGHDWGEWEVVTQPTTTSPGLEQRVCKRDPSHVETRDIPPLEGGEEDLPIAEINLSAACRSGPYYVGETIDVAWTLENEGDVAVTYRDCDGDALFANLPETLEPKQTVNWTVPHTISADDYSNGFYISPESGETCDTSFETSHVVFYASAEYVYDPGYGNPWECFDEVTIIENVEQGVEGPSLFLSGVMDPQKMEFSINETVNFHLKLTNNGSETLDYCGNLYTVAFGTPSEETKGTLEPGDFFEFDYSYTFTPEMAGALIPFEWRGYGYRIGGRPGGGGPANDDNPSLVWSNTVAGRLQVKDGPALFLTVDQTENFKTEYELNDNPIFHTRATNTGNVNLTHVRTLFWIENTEVLEGWPDNDPDTVEPGISSHVYGWNHAINEEDMKNPGLIYHWKAYGYLEGIYAPPADPNAPGNPEGIVWSNECTVEIPLARKAGDLPMLILTNLDGSGEGKGLGDWVSTQLTLENAGETLLNIRAIVYAAPLEYGAVLSNYRSEEFENRIEGTVYWVTETDTFGADIQVLPADVAKGAVDRRICLIANLPGHEEPPFVYSNFTEIHIPLDTEPVPPDDDREASLALFASCSDPEPFWFNFDGYTDMMTYDLIVINTGSVPVALTALTIATESGPLVVDLTGTLLPGDSYPASIGNAFAESDVVNGNELHISFTASGDSQLGPVTSNEAAFVHEVGEQPPWTPDPTTVFMIKMETSTSQNFGGYTEGENVTYEVAVTNTSETAIPSITISDDHCPGQDVTLYDLQPYETRYVPFQYTVTQPDVDDGYILNTATAVWTCPVAGTEQKEESTCVVDTTKIPDKQQYGFDLMKACLNTPKDGPYFVEDEPVTFYVYVENTSTAELYDVDVTDPLTGDSVHYDVMTPGQIGDLYFTYTVTYSDAAMGSVTNTVYVTGRDENGKEYSRSADVTIPTGIPPVPGTASLYVFKEETSVPSDPRGYQESEFIDYTVTVTNDGDVDLYNVEVYDITPEGYIAMLGMVPLMHPNDQQSFSYSWEVRDWNIADEWVYNLAYAHYDTGTVSGAPVFSNTTESPTWAPTPVPPPPGTPEPGEAESCKFSLTASGSAETWLELEQCGEHAETRAKAAELVAAEAWDEACALWLEEIHGMYDRLSRHIASKDRAKAAADRAALDHMAASMEDGRAKLDWLMLQCAELCYLNGNAPENRPDSRIFGRTQAAPTLVMAGGEPACGLTVQADEGRKVQVIESLCAEHAEGEAAVTTMLNNSRTRAQFGDVFGRAQRLWRSYLDQATSAAWKAAAGEEDRYAVVAGRQAFDQWLAARGELLAVLYPDRPETVAEILCNILRRQVLTNCAK